MSLTRFLVLIFLLAVSPLSFPHTEAGANTIDLQIQPGLDNIRPLTKPTKLTLTFHNSAGKAMDGSQLQIRLYAPPRGWLFSTDFPQVEGTPLLEMEMPAVTGNVEWEYVFPIRGDYRLEAGVVDSVGNTAKRVFSLPIKESRTKLFYLGIFLTGLFLFGVMVGRLFTLRSGESRITGGLLFLVGSVPIICSATAQESTTKVAGDKEFVVRLEVSPATVGELSQIRWRLSEAKTGLPYPTHLTLAITQLEKGEQIFSLKRLQTKGNLNFKFHFVDGSPHRVSGIAELKGRDPIRAEKVVSVTGVEPPKAISLRALVLFLAVVVVGLITGRLSRRGGKQ